MRFFLIIACIGLSAPAFGQQLLPSQLALQIDTAVNSMAAGLENNQKIIAELQSQIANLKAKCGEACKDEAATDPAKESIVAPRAIAPRSLMKRSKDDKPIVRKELPPPQHTPNAMPEGPGPK